MPVHYTASHNTTLKYNHTKNQQTWNVKCSCNDKAQKTTLFTLPMMILQAKCQWKNVKCRKQSKQLGCNSAKNTSESTNTSLHIKSTNKNKLASHHASNYKKIFSLMLPYPLKQSLLDIWNKRRKLSRSDWHSLISKFKEFTCFHRTVESQHFYIKTPVLTNFPLP
jgi:hypothetical protein